ncbi:branched-chain amino acid transporter permease [Thorsellia kenyensis]|uniref:Branched-chain amino acid transporter permease n=1 Tax=Thorsellia kenyensis TaxID=1549888 RepID=A0ABV6CB46_9GAMM
MSTHGYIISAIAIMACITFLLRAIPFWLMRKKRVAFIDYLGFMMPPGIMIILVIYSINGLNYTGASSYLNMAVSCLSVVLLHHFFRNSLLSITLGTGIYIALGYWI